MGRRLGNVERPVVRRKDVCRADRRAEKTNGDFSRIKSERKPWPRGNKPPFLEWIGETVSAGGWNFCVRPRFLPVRTTWTVRARWRNERTGRTTIRTIITSRQEKRRTITVKARREHSQKAKMSIRPSARPLRRNSFSARGYYCCAVANSLSIVVLRGRGSMLSFLFLFSYLFDTRLERRNPREKGEECSEGLRAPDLQVGELREYTGDLDVILCVCILCLDVRLVRIWFQPNWELREIVCEKKNKTCVCDS